MHGSLRWLKPLVFMACLLPGLGVAYRALAGTLGVNPIESLHHTFGDWTLRFLILTLLITPLRLIPGWHGLTRLRRMLGLYAFFYASLHVGGYVVLDQQFDWTEIWVDITKRPYIALGITAYMLMIPLALTSTTSSIQRMGSYWQRLHQLIYLVTALGILHFYLLVKADVREPLFYAAVFALLLILRVVLGGRKVQKEHSRLKKEDDGSWGQSG